MNTYLKQLPKLFALIMIFMLMFGTRGLPPLLSGTTNASAAGGVAQLKIVTQSPIVRTKVVGINQYDETAEWDQFFSPTTTVTTDDWWWRFKWFWYPSLDVAPHVWVWYANGSRDNKLCSVSDIGLLADEVTCEFPEPPALPTPSGFSEISKGYGISLYQKDGVYIQRVSLGLGASVELLNGGIVPDTNRPGYYGGNDPKFTRQSLSTTWNQFSGTYANEFCITNGQFFSPDEDPTRLAFFVKQDDQYLTDGYNIDGTTLKEEFRGQRMMLEIWPDRANMTLLPEDKVEAGEILYDPSRAPNIIVGGTETADKGVTVSDSRTFIAIVDYNNDTIFETILIFNSTSATQVEAAAALRSFGAVGRTDEVKVMMLDGGGSTQLICNFKNDPVVKSTDGGDGRLLPQTIGTTSGKFTGVGDFYFTNYAHIYPGETIKIIASVAPLQAVLTFSTSWPGSDVEMTLKSPSGRVIDRATAATDVVHDLSLTSEMYIISDPEPGDWEVSLYGADVPPEGEDVTFTFTTGSSAPVPVLAYVDGDTLVLNMGSAERRAARNIQQDEINEDFLVLQLEADKFAVTAFGITQIFSGASRVEAEADDGNDTITLEAGSFPFTAPADLKGGSGDDLLQSGDAADMLSGGSGNDTINAGGGNDTISGDEGNDELNGQDGQDGINGGSENDTLSGGGEVDNLHGDAGDDRISGDDGADQIYGDAGADSLYGGSAEDSINGGTENDTMEGNDGADAMHGDVGDDRMLGQDGADIMYGDAGNDDMDGGTGADRMEGNDGADVMRGGSENDTMNGNADADEMYGDGEQDTIYGNAGNDVMHGGADDDYMEGNEDSDTMYGDEDQDDMLGGSPSAGTSDGHDAMYGGSDHDVMIGDNGTIARSSEVNSYNGSIQRDVVLFDVQLADDSASTNVSGNDNMNGDDGDDIAFGQGGDDSISGGAGDDYLEGNADSDTINGDAGQDDVVGGGSANDGVIDADRRGDGLSDAGDEIHGGDNGDILAGDNARITKLVDTVGEWQIDPNTGKAERQVILFDVEVIAGNAVNPLTSGSDLMFGDAGKDQMFGQGNGQSGNLVGTDPQDGVDNDRNGRENGSILGMFDCLDGRDNDNDGLVDSADPQCAATIDNSPGGDEMHGGADDDYIEGNHGSDWIFGDDGEDDILGGSSSGDGIVGGLVMPLGLTDGHDVISGNGEDDVLLGDNARIMRAVEANDINKRLVGGLFDLAIRDVRMSANSLDPSGGFGNDWMSGGAGTDDMYGQLGNDYMEGNDGEDAMVGDLGKITNNLMGISDGIPDPGSEQYIAPIAPFFDPGELIYQHDSLYRLVKLYYFLTNSGGAGDDIMYGGGGSDVIHGGAGNDVMNGNGGDDRLFGGDNSDAIWGGPDHDIMFGGYGNDYLDVLPRLKRTIKKVFYPADPSPWFEAAMVDNYQGIDTMYGGWDRDWMQADISVPGRVNGDRMIDWVGAFNAYYRCDAAYGDWVITRQHSPSVEVFLQNLAQGFGALNTKIIGTSGFRETAIVFPSDVKYNSNPLNPDNPAHFTCESSH